jgi:hypothetical protein
MEVRRAAFAVVAASEKACVARRPQLADFELSLHVELSRNQSCERSLKHLENDG